MFPSHLLLKKLENGVNNKIKVNFLQILYIIFDPIIDEIEVNHYKKKKKQNYLF